MIHDDDIPVKTLKQNVTYLRNPFAFFTIIQNSKLFLVTKMYKLAKGISPAIMQEILRFRNSRTFNGTESISYLDPKF